ncbi:MAG: rubredoxin [Clostridia bacterium]|jgi:rubredoxin|nr:rubredoxin [Clostridia bacterium]
MKEYKCIVCSYVYREEKGEPMKDIEPNTKFEDLPENFKCPKCNQGKMMFEEKKN